ncbi:hypothetical protein EOD39_3208 [Acipenser ruthenus]|uniref:Uncharacterized protein n=1 Tax=Acipenser ruthenus TaxID=7906 RepID=A0A444UPI8_ACIRT|nr:hypothetical protein EOD39_3208 [Acipenser ruthenus]
MAVPEIGEVGTATAVPETGEVWTAMTVPETGEVGTATAVPETGEVWTAMTVPKTGEVGTATAVPETGEPILQLSTAVSSSDPDISSSLLPQAPLVSSKLRSEIQEATCQHVYPPTLKSLSSSFWWVKLSQGAGSASTSICLFFAPASLLIITLDTPSGSEPLLLLLLEMFLHI